MAVSAIGSLAIWRLLLQAGDSGGGSRVGEEFHAAIGVGNDEQFARSKQLITHDQGPDRIVARELARIANDMRVALYVEHARMSLYYVIISD
jgi:hypothetical protein